MLTLVSESDLAQKIDFDVEKLKFSYFASFSLFSVTTVKSIDTKTIRCVKRSRHGKRWLKYEILAFSIDTYFY